MKKGLMIVISGPAGSGKGTVNAQLLQSDEYVYSVSATTRAPRPGEVDGKNYYFITKEDFEGRIADGQMLEYTCYCGNYYGTPLKEALAVLDSGKNLVLEIEVEGALNVKRLYPEAVLIMLLPPDFATQEARLRGRGTETEDKILGRLEQTREELKHLDIYDYIVYNETGKSDVCRDDILSIIHAEKLSRKRNPNAEKKYFGDRQGRRAEKADGLPARQAPP